MQDLAPTVAVLNDLVKMARLAGMHGRGEWKEPAGPLGKLP
jgi:hypothetical protein